MKQKIVLKCIKKHWRKRLEGGSCDDDSLKKVITLETAMTKKVVSFFSEKNRGDTVSQLPPRVTPTLVTPLTAKNGHFAFLSLALGGLGATHAIYLKLIGKPVVKFL